MKPIDYLNCKTVKELQKDLAYYKNAIDLNPRYNNKTVNDYVRLITMVLANKKARGLK